MLYFQNKWLTLPCPSHLNCPICNIYAPCSLESENQNTNRNKACFKIGFMNWHSHRNFSRKKRNSLGGLYFKQKIGYLGASLEIFKIDDQNLKENFLINFLQKWLTYICEKAEHLL
jgi:hypothetical protein